MVGILADVIGRICAVYAQSQSLHNGTQTLVYVCHALYVLLTNTDTALREKDEGSIYLLTDVMNISA